ncbi:MAG TPA: sigma-70 family RNA polymerase sigma factor [bacterium]|nr:sigma-70 family RNA polymerase sigma factor [bacterium]HMY35141.1 sigma-70 family RNA polymerase sigma factor [bacterium]HMZ04508.1 sigma-70 family RNA polymerase sigma factor [bacterium]HND76124.1 sigma-70 family RNA polymerase sigma factor [bacterium]HNL27683.1 sigma-70 family RNA polymerase sigma factor [bacterium]
MKNEYLKQAVNGDIQAFQKLFLEFQDTLRSYLYRLVTDRHDVEDISQDTFVKAFDKISTFKGESSFKTWVFQIATNLAYDLLRDKKRWKHDAQDQAKAYASSSTMMRQRFLDAHHYSPHGAYHVREHIDFCFTCIAKTLPIDEQITLILKDIYDFSRKEIGMILGLSEGVIKHRLFDARKKMQTIFDSRCALVNKNGVCYQCTELADFFNPESDHRKTLQNEELIRRANTPDREKLYELRAKLVSQIDPLRSEGSDLQDIIMQCTRIAIGEMGPASPDKKGRAETQI